MRLVLIEWEDSHTEGGWQRIGGPIEDRALICQSAGWLILDGERATVIAPHVNTPEDQVDLQGAGIMTIPARAVLRMVDLAQHDTANVGAVTCPSSCSEPG
jgi:hypothetical protein